MRSTQAEVLLRIAENTFSNGDDALAETRQKLSAHARQILNDEELLIQAWEINQRDKARFAQYMPADVQQGKAREQVAIGNITAQNRVAKLEVQQRAAFESKANTEHN